MCSYSFREDDPFALQVRAATFDLSTDEGTSQRPQKANQLKWDRKKKRFIAGNAIGADNKKMIRSESGAQLPASFRSGRYEKWLKARRNVTIDGSEGQHAASSLVKATFRGARRSPRGQAPRFDPDTSGLQQRRRLSKTGVSSTGGRKTTSPRQRELKSAEGVLRNRQNVERVSFFGHA